MSLLPEAGDRFGQLTVVGESWLRLHHKPEYGRRRWVMVRCDCGDVQVMPAARLHKATRCRDCANRAMTKRNPIIPVGTVFGMRTVIGPIEFRGKGTNRRRYLPVRCACGDETTVLIYDLLDGNATACRSCSASGERAANYTHGGTSEPLYHVWTGIKYRCLNPGNVAWHRYGGRGITISPLWINDFAAFRDWSMANGYQRGLQIDRIDNDGNYDPDNCRWVSLQVNQRNKGNRVEIEAFGEAKSAAEWTEDPRCVCKSRPALAGRIRLGWDPVRAITTPVRPRAPYRPRKAA